MSFLLAVAIVAFLVWLFSRNTSPASFPGGQRAVEVHVQAPDPVDRASPADCFVMLLHDLSSAEYALQRFDRAEAGHTSQDKLIDECIRRLGVLLDRHGKISAKLRKNFGQTLQLMSSDGVRRRCVAVLDDIGKVAGTSQSRLSRVISQDYEGHLLLTSIQNAYFDELKRLHPILTKLAEDLREYEQT